MEKHHLLVGLLALGLLAGCAAPAATSYYACYPNRDWEGDQVLVCAPFSKDELGRVLGRPPHGRD